MISAKINVISCALNMMALCFILSQCTSSGSHDANKSADAMSAPDTSAVMNMPEESPRFPGCEELQSKEEKKKCADKKLLEYVYNHIQYPEYAKSNGVQGRCVISFIVEKDGKISNAKIIKDIGGGCGEASLSVVNTFNEMKERWIAGIEKGKAVRALYYLPVNFRLEEKQVK
jgi:protein TonB